MIFINFTAHWRWLPTFDGHFEDSQIWFGRVRWVGVEASFNSRAVASCMVDALNRSKFTVEKA